MTEAVATDVARNHEDVFEDIYDSERWGKGMGSGSGSDPDYCKGFLDHLISVIPPGCTVLDLGCGDLQMYNGFAVKRWNYIGADISDTALALAHQNQPDLYLTKLSAQDTKGVLELLAEEKVQFLVMKDVIMHWTDHEIETFFVPLVEGFDGTIILANSFKYWRDPTKSTYPRVLDRYSWAPIPSDHPVLARLGFKPLGKYARGKKEVLIRQKATVQEA